MKEIVDALLGVIEFLILGSLSAIGTMYLLAFYHPIPQRLREYFPLLWQTLCGDMKSLPHARGLVTAFALSSLYFGGVVTNVVNYWVLTPVHRTVIAEAASMSAKSSSPGPQSLLSDKQFLLEAVVLTLTRERIDSSGYVTYLRKETTWRRGHSESLASVLPGLLKFIRIIRGVAVFGMLLLVVAAAKVLLGAIVLMVLWLRAAARQLPGWLAWPYARFVASESVKGGETVADARRVTWLRMVAPNLIILAIAAFLAAVGLLAYRTVETEYQLIVHLSE